MGMDPVLVVARTVLDCLTSQLEATVAGPVCVSIVRHSAVVPPADDCHCECTDPAGAVCGRGEAWVRVVQSQLGELSRRCPPAGWQVALELGVRRCVETVGRDGQPPDPQVLEGEAVWLADDARAQRRVLACCPALKDRDLRTIVQRPSGALGGCAGWVTTFVTDLRGG